MLKRVVKPNNNSNESEKSSDCVECSRTDNVKKFNESLVSLGEMQIKKEKKKSKTLDQTLKPTFVEFYHTFESISGSDYV